MGTILAAMTSLEKTFFVCAVVGGAFFVVRMILQFAGLHHGDADSVDLTHADSAGMDSHGTDSDISFKLFSMQGLTAFFLMFGLVGLAILGDSPARRGWAVIAGTVSGLGTVWIMGKLFGWMKGLQASGTFDIATTVGCEGTVYLTIPPAQEGKVQLTACGRMKILEAVSATKEEIKTGERVQVTGVVSGNTIIVEKI